MRRSQVVFFRLDSLFYCVLKSAFRLFLWAHKKGLDASSCLHPCIQYKEEKLISCFFLFFFFTLKLRGLTEEIKLFTL